MTCEEFEVKLESSLPEAATETHVAECAACARRLDDTRMVRRSMQYLVVSAPTLQESARLARRITGPPFSMDWLRWSRLVTAGVGQLVFVRLVWCALAGAVAEPTEAVVLPQTPPTLTERMETLFSRRGGS